MGLDTSAVVRCLTMTLKIAAPGKMTRHSAASSEGSAFDNDMI